jgi:hypothetical protein
MPLLRDPLRLALGAAAMALSAFTPAVAENIDPATDGSRYAYAENIGWINALPLGPGGPGVDVGDFTITGWMWGENVGWVSLSCEDTASCGIAAYRVSNDGEGHLSGFAWGENVGWVNFAQAGAGVTIDPITGDFSGRAWAENIGWITFASAGPVSYRVRTGWCSTTASAPVGSPSLTVETSEPDTQLSWSALTDASWYDVVRGSIGVLRSSVGDFTAAAESCVASNTTATSVLSSETPSSGDGDWFLVRAANCRGRGTWDSGAPSQIGSRDAEIDAAAASCP